MLRALLGFPLLRRSARYVLGRYRRERVERIEGLPMALDFEILDAVCREQGRGALKRCAHLHLSSWKSRGTYRLELCTEAGTSWRLIFKDECYQPELIPALEGLPVSPGPPEAVLYRQRNAVLSPFLPQLHWFSEVEPGRHFQYLLEDLAQTHAILPPDEVAPLKRATRGLLQIHQALRETLAAKAPDGLLRYDRRYSERLLDYALRNLTDYAARTGDGAVAAVTGRWHELVAAHQRDEFYDDELRVPIHGDYNTSNIHAHRDDGSRLKVVDWEWAGVGLPHADLAALIKYVRPQDQPVLLQVFLEEDRRLDLEQHRRLFHWCLLERRLLDGAFLARQQLVSARRVWWLQPEIRRSACDVLATVEWLGASPRTLATA
jgi:hypothetical protein